MDMFIKESSYDFSSDYADETINKVGSWIYYTMMVGAPLFTLIICMIYVDGFINALVVAFLTFLVMFFMTTFSIIVPFDDVDEILMHVPVKLWGMMPWVYDKNILDMNDIFEYPDKRLTRRYMLIDYDRSADISPKKEEINVIYDFKYAKKIHYHDDTPAYIQDACPVPALPAGKLIRKLKDVRQQQITMYQSEERQKTNEYIVANTSYDVNDTPAVRSLQRLNERIQSEIDRSTVEIITKAEENKLIIRRMAEEEGTMWEKHQHL